MIGRQPCLVVAMLCSLLAIAVGLRRGRLDLMGGNHH